MSAKNVCQPFYRPGADITCVATAPVVGKRFVSISGNRSTDLGNGNISVAHATAGEYAFGVSGLDAATGSKFHVITDPGAHIPVTAGGNIAAGAEVQVGANGTAVTLASGVSVGRCLNAVTNGNDAEIKFHGR